MFKKIIAALILAVASLVYSQQPQANDLPPTQPIFATNAKLVNGVAPGYWPTAASTGLTLNVSAGTSFFGSAVRQNGAQTLTMVNGTNYVYLDSTTGALASSTSNFTTGQFPIAVVTASGGNITSILDVRTMFFTIGSGSTGNSVQYPASNTAYNFFGGSRWIVATPVEITSTGVACDGINCTITATQSYTVGQPIQFYGTWAPTCLEWDIVPVATTGSTSFTVSESNTTCTGTQTGSGGTLRDATYFIPNLFSKEPYVSGHNSIVRNLGIAGGTLQNAVTNYSTLIHPYTHAVTGLPTVDFVDYGDNDISGSCSSLATMQSLMETFYADLHADGDIIVQTGIPWYEVNSITCTTADSTLDLFNTWLAHHSKGTETLANGYSDRFADLETVVSNPTDTTCYNSDQIHLGNGCTQLVANRLNSVISTQNSSNVNHLLGQGPNYMYGFQNMTAGYGTGNWAMQTTSGFAYVNGLFSLNGGSNTLRFIAHAFPCWSNTVGGGILPYSAANCNVQLSQNYSLANTLAVGQGGTESDATGSLQFKYWYPTGVTSSPALTYDGQQWYNSTTHQPCYNNNGTAVCGWGASGGSAWSSLTNPTANLALSMGANTSTFTYGATTGTSDMFALTDTASNTGTGILLHAYTASGSTEIPFKADANGCGWEINAVGAFVSTCTTHATQMNMTYSTGFPPVVGSATTAVYAVDASGNAEVSSAGAAFSLICTQATGCPGSGSTAWSAIASGNNTNTLTMGTGGSLNPTGTGIINANEVNGATIAANLTSLATNASGQIVAGSGGSGNYVNIGSSVTWTPSGSMTGSFASGKFTVSGAGTVLTITNIPAGINLLVKGKGTESVLGQIKVQFNGDVGNTYSWAGSYIAQPSTATIGSCGGVGSDTSISCLIGFGTLTGQFTFEVDGYTDSFPKSVRGDSELWVSLASSANNQRLFGFGMWDPATQAAITSITLTCVNACSVGDTFEIYNTN